MALTETEVKILAALTAVDLPKMLSVVDLATQTGLARSSIRLALTDMAAKALTVGSAGKNTNMASYRQRAGRYPRTYVSRVSASERGE